MPHQGSPQRAVQAEQRDEVDRGQRFRGRRVDVRSVGGAQAEIRPDVGDELGAVPSGRLAPNSTATSAALARPRSGV